jgi:hypothetical protein
MNFKSNHPRDTAEPELYFRIHVMRDRCAGLLLRFNYAPSIA